MTGPMLIQLCVSMLVESRSKLVNADLEYSERPQEIVQKTVQNMLRKSSVCICHDIIPNEFQTSVLYISTHNQC